MDNADLRTGIRDEIVAQIAAVAGRVFWGWTAPAETPKPFVAVMFAGDLPSINTPLGLFTRVDVFVVGDEGDVHNLDPISDGIMSALHKQDITTPAGRTIRPEYRRDSRMDGWSEDFKGNTIRTQYWIPTDFWT